MNLCFKKFFQAKTLQQGLAPLTFVECFTGLAPFTYKIKPGVSESKIIIPWLIFNSFAIFTYVYSLAKITINKEFFNKSSDSPSFTVLKNCVLLYSGFFLMIIFFTSIYYRKNNYAGIIKNLQYIDLLYERFNMKTNYTRMKIKIFFISYIYKYFLFFISKKKFHKAF